MAVAAALSEELAALLLGVREMRMFADGMLSRSSTSAMTAAGMPTPSTTRASAKPTAVRRRVRRLCDAMRSLAPLGPPLMATKRSPSPSTSQNSTKIAMAIAGADLTWSGSRGTLLPGGGRHRHRLLPAAKLWTAGATPRKSASSAATSPPSASSGSERVSGTTVASWPGMASERSRLT